MIKCENLSLGYDGKAIVENLNFEIKDGDYLCIIGENGVGKSTLIKTLLKLIKPISGEVIYNENLVPTEIGYLSQQQQLMKDFPASVFEIVISGCQSKAARVNPWCDFPCGIVCDSIETHSIRYRY